MGRLARFLRLERARPGDAHEAEPAAHASLRFQAIEPRRAAPSAAPADPFGPPREREVQLELAPNHAPAADRAKLERRARAEAELAELARERAQLALERRPPEPSWLDHRAIHALVKLTPAGRVVVIGTAALVIGILAQLAGPIVWGLFPIVAAVVIVGHFLHQT